MITLKHRLGLGLLVSVFPFLLLSSFILSFLHHKSTISVHVFDKQKGGYRVIPARALSLGSWMDSVYMPLPFDWLNKYHKIYVSCMIWLAIVFSLIIKYLSDSWLAKTEDVHIPASSNSISVNFPLTPGHSYRFGLKFCAEEICYNTLNTTGVRVIPNPPKTGKNIVLYFEENKRVLLLQEFDPLRYLITKVSV